MATTDVRRITDSADVHAAAGLFDNSPLVDATDRFLGDAGHHLLIAYLAGEPVGMITGIEMTHPDKGTEMFLYELGVDESHRGQGVGRSLVAALATLARELGCYGMWVLTDDDNDAAVATYRAAGAIAGDNSRQLNWEFGHG